MLLDPGTFRRLCRARELLCTPDGPTVAEVARTVAMSPRHFARTFAALHGETPRQLRIRARLDRARELLAAGRSVTDVCMEVGFASLGSFSQLFASRVGETPSAYGRRARATTPPGCLSLMAAAFGSFEEAPAAPPVAHEGA